MIDTDLSPPTVRHRAMIQGTRTRSVRAGRVAFLSAVACAVALGGAAYALGGHLLPLATGGFRASHLGGLASEATRRQSPDGRHLEVGTHR